MEKKTLRSLFLLAIITGSLFTFVACGPEAKEVEDGEKKEIEKVEEVENDDSKATSPVTQPPVKNPVETTKPTTQSDVKVTTKYVDGTYTKVGSYQSPGGKDSITVSVTVKNDVVESVSLVNGGTNEGSVYSQNLFIDGVKAEVVGKKLSEINVGKVNGSSLTGIGFNIAVDQIRTAAQK